MPLWAVVLTGHRSKQRFYSSVRIFFDGEIDAFTQMADYVEAHGALAKPAPATAGFPMAMAGNSQAAGYAPRPMSAADLKREFASRAATATTRRTGLSSKSRPGSSNRSDQ
jgi:hypothetical protein